MNLDELLNDQSDRQFWLKPIGPPRDRPEWDEEEYRVWTQSEIEMGVTGAPLLFNRLTSCMLRQSRGSQRGLQR